MYATDASTNRDTANARNENPHQDPRPNFLVFVTDQQRADHLGCAGNPIVQTPHIDAIARRGTRFDRSYVANPVCQPARASLLTGLAPRDHGVRTNGIPLSSHVPTFVEALRRAGYRTHSVGKLHLRNYQVQPPQRAVSNEELDELYESAALWNDERIGSLPVNYAGFETSDFTGQHGPGIFGDYRRWLREQDEKGPWLLTREAGTPRASGAEQSWVMALPSELHYNSWIAERTIAFLRRQTEANRPFFLWCSFPDPHHPYCPPRPWAEKYDESEIPLPNRRDGELNDLPPHFRMAFEEDVVLSGRHGATRISDPQIRDITALTYSMVSMVDHQIGSIMAKLEQLGVAENTVVVFLSDHGDMMGDHWMLNKGPFHFDGLLRVPTIWSWPKHFQEGVVSSALVSQLDFAPTILDLAGVPLPGLKDPPDVDGDAPPPAWPGASLRELLAGEVERHHDQVLIEMDEDYLNLRLRTLITDDCQITAYPGQPFGEMFDLKNDPKQVYNLWDHPDHHQRRQEMQIRLMEQLVATQYGLPQRDSHA